MERLTKQQVIDKLQTLEFSPLKIKCREVGPYLSFPGANMQYCPDALIDIAWKGKTYEFVAEIRSISTPKIIDNAMWQIADYLKLYKNRLPNTQFYPLIVVPYLSKDRLDRLAEAEISGIDLSGNGIVIVPGKMFIYRSGEPNKFRSSEPIKNIYRGSSSIVARTLLIRQEYSTVNEVLDEIVKRRGKPTLGTVSKVLKSLENDLLISRNQGVRLIDATGLLTKLRGNYRQPKQQRRIVGKIDRLDNALTKISENCDRNEVSCAVDEPRRYAVFPTVGVPTRIFTENINKALDGIDFEETDRFPNVELIETPEPAVYFDRRCSLSDGVYYTSPLQTYLDLTTGGKREIETAEQIAKKLLKFEYS